jgi:hypothetical protein
LLAGGTGDSLWSRDAIPDNPELEVLELPGVDHALQVPGEPLPSIDALSELTSTVQRFAEQVRS